MLLPGMSSGEIGTAQQTIQPRSKKPTDPIVKEFNKEISSLEKSEEVSVFEPWLKKYKNTRTQLHGNTYLLYALSCNFLNACILIIRWDKEKRLINARDTFGTSLSTPLILAAKMNTFSVVSELLNHGANPDHQDYRGFTALHYACIYRNEAMITALLNAGADISLRTMNFNTLWCCFYKSQELIPLYYYTMEIALKDLRYPHGIQDGKLLDAWDWDQNYFGTHKKSLSALRWFIGKAMANGQVLTPEDLNSYPEVHRLHCIKDAQLYDLLMQRFCDYRQKTSINQELLDKLTITPQKTKKQSLITETGSPLSNPLLSPVLS